MDEAGEQALAWLDKQDSLLITTGNADERDRKQQRVIQRALDEWQPRGVESRGKPAAGGHLARERL